MSAPLIELPEGPPAKRQKVAVATQDPKLTKSRIFAPFRTIGLVSPTLVPFSSAPLGKTSFHITTSTGRGLQTYDLRKGLNLVFLTRPQTPGPITANATWSDRVMVAWSTGRSTGARGIWIFKRGKKLQELPMPSDLDQDVVQILVFGSWIVGCCSTRIEIWSSVSLEHWTTIWPPFVAAAGGSKGSILTGGICTLPTYTNKVFAGREDGSVEIWNVSTGKLIYRILPSSSDSGPVSVIEPAPALSLLAIAYISGMVVIHDVRTDKEILRLNAGQGGQSPITSISFRTDGLGAGPEGRKTGVMAMASFSSGDVTLWDLNKGGKRMSTLRGAHSEPTVTSEEIDGGISKIEFLPGQAVLVTSGADNSLKTWIFDDAPYSPIPRILHARSGHAAPVTTLSFLPSDADGAEMGNKWLLSSGKDRSLWGWSLRRDGQSTELSQGPVHKKAKRLGATTNRAGEQIQTIQDLKAPEITCIACSLNRDGGMGTLPGTKDIWTDPKKQKGKSTATEQNITGWESVVTGHKGDKFARTWFWGRKRAGRWIFETSDAGGVTSVAISPCGTFALVGSSSGGIDMFNLQSGIRRQRFPNPVTPAQARRIEAQKAQNPDVDASKGLKSLGKGVGKHTSAVTGIEVDNLNRTVVSCSLDGKVKFWDFHAARLITQVDYSAVTTLISMRQHRSSSLLSVASTDRTLRIIDLQARRLVREFFIPSPPPKSLKSPAYTVRIKDHAFSPDGRWLLASSSDRTIRIWDLPTGHMIDAIRLQSVCTAFALSHSGEYLATALDDSVGVHVWTNRTIFSHITTRPLREEDIRSVDEPTPSGEGGQSLIAPALEEQQSSEQDDIGDGLDMPAEPDAQQLSAGLMTLSLIPRSRVHTLLHYDAIRARNKPIETPKAPEKAPFFLPSVGAQPQPQQRQQPTLQQTDTQPPQSQTHLIKSNTTPDDFTAILLSCAENSHHNTNAPEIDESYTPFHAHLRELTHSPSRADLAIRTLSPDPPYTELIAFLNAMTASLRMRRDFDLVRAWMRVWLKAFGGVVSEAVENARLGWEGEQDVDVAGEDAMDLAVAFPSNEGDGEQSRGCRELVEALRVYREEQRREVDRVGGRLSYCLGVLGFLRSSR